MLSTVKETSEGGAGWKVTESMENVVLIFTNTCTHDGIGMRQQIITTMVSMVYCIGDYASLPQLSINDTLMLKEQVNTEPQSRKHCSL